MKPTHTHTYFFSVSFIFYSCTYITNVVTKLNDLFITTLYTYFHLVGDKKNIYYCRGNGLLANISTLSI